jgi:hypothetical protein
MTGIMCATLGMGSNFTAVFNNAENINIVSRGGFGYTYVATYTINTNATCSKDGTPFGLDFSGGPTAWGTPTGGVPGNDYEVRLNVANIYLDTPALSYVSFAGVNVATTGYTPWYDLSSNRAIEASSSGQVAQIDGTLYIRNKYSLVEISRAFAVAADPTY